MRLDYWNHPLIVKALRVKYRGGRLFMIASAYLALLLIGAMLLYQYRDTMRLKDWARFFFVCMISLQFVISSLIAISATSSSMQSEVASRTLDFQRIAAISPLQILLGKAVGEPASSYMLAMVTIPIAVLCSTVGNISLLAIALLYITLATTTFLAACLGLQHSLDPTSKGAQTSGLVGAMFLVTFVATSIPLTFGATGGVIELIGVAVGLFTPILSIKGIAMEGSTIWTATMPFFIGNIPYALLAPVAQTALASLLLLFMTRRLRQPLTTALSKPQSYGVLLVLDLLWAAFQFDALRLGEGLTGPAVRFAAGHACLAIVLASRTVTGRETFSSWVWRLRGRQNWLWDHIAGERTLNAIALVLYCLLGICVFMTVVAIPATFWRPGIFVNTHWPKLWSATTVMVMVILAYGLFYQVLTVTMGRGAAITLFLSAVVGMFAPYATGARFGWPLVTSLSPVATFVRLHDVSAQPYPLLPITLFHVAFIALWTWYLTQMARRTILNVDRRLASIGVQRQTITQAAQVPPGSG